MFARGGGEFGEEKPGAALVARPDYVGVSLQSYLRAGEHAAKGDVRGHRHGFGGLDGEAVLADVDADAREHAIFEFEINQGLYFIARGLALVRFVIFLVLSQSLHERLGLERAIKNAARAGLKRLSRAGPC